MRPFSQRSGRVMTALLTAFIFLLPACPQKPAADAVPMEIVKTTRVIFHFGAIKPVIVSVLDEGAVVLAHETSDGWYKVWWQYKGVWKTGYVDSTCLRPLRDAIGG